MVDLDVVYPELRKLARDTREQNPILRRMVFGELSECAWFRDYIHLSEVAVLYAYATVAEWRATCGRRHLTGEAAEALLTELQRNTEPPLHVLGRVRALDLAVDGKLVCRVARRWLCRELQGRATSYTDARTRRTTRLPYPQAGWDAWRDSGWGPGEPPVPQEVDLHQQCLDELNNDLAHVLNEWELYVIREHFFKGRRQRDIGKEVAATNPKYKGDWERAEYMVQKTVTRALVRLKRRLGVKWQDMVARGS
jgi:hypothetical protein